MRLGIVLAGLAAIMLALLALDPMNLVRNDVPRKIIEPPRRSELEIAEIKTYHYDLFRVELPQYVTNLRGKPWQTPDESEPSYSHASWGGVVPHDRLSDFKEYLMTLGVPRESFDKPIPMSSKEFLSSKRDLRFFASGFYGPNQVKLDGLDFGMSDLEIEFRSSKFQVHLQLSMKSGNFHLLQQTWNIDD